MALFKNKLPQTTILMVEVGRTSNASVTSSHPRSVFIKLAVVAVGTLNAQRPLITLTLMIRDPPAAIEMWASAASRGIPWGQFSLGGAPLRGSLRKRSSRRAPPAKIAPQGRNYYDIFAI